MPTKSKKSKDTSVLNKRFNQSVSEDLFNDLELIRKRKSFDSVQALVRFICADFVLKNPVR